MEMSDQLHAPAAIPPGKESPVPLERRLGGPQRLCGRYEEDKNLLPLPVIEPQLTNP
jgi:hypothetical protein